MAATTGYAAGLDANAAELSFAVETTWGTAPSVQFQAIRMLSESLSGSKTRDRPKEISPRRQASAAITQDESAGGQVSIAFSATTYDEWLAAVLGTDWSDDLNITGSSADISTVATGNKLTSTTSGKFDDVVVGQYIKLKGFSSNNGVYRVSVKTSGTDLTLAGGTVTNETPTGSNARVIGSYARNGTLFKSLFIQKKLASDKFLIYPGSFLSGGSISAAVKQFLQGSFTLLSKSESKSATDSSTGDVLAAPTGKVHDNVAGFKSLQWNDSAVAATVDMFSLDMQNEEAAADYGLGSSAAAGMRPGTFNANGTFRTFFKDFTYYDLFKAETAGRISFRTEDSTGAGYVISLPSATIMNPKIVAGGRGQPVMAEFMLEANPDATLDCMVQICRYAA